jgi:hypothetical protein
VVDADFGNIEYYLTVPSGPGGVTPKNDGILDYCPPLGTYIYESGVCNTSGATVVLS